VVSNGDLLVGDFDGDGRADVIWGRVVVSQFANGQFHSIFYSPQSLIGDATVQADFDLTGAQDVATVLGGVPYVYLNGMFSQSLQLPSGNIFALAAGDWNGDHVPDVAAATTDGKIWLARGDGHGGFALPVAVAVSLEANEEVWALASLDFDGNGTKDLVL